MKLNTAIPFILFLALILLAGCTNPTVCGDDICAIGENISSSPNYCPRDCGAPPETASLDVAVLNQINNNPIEGALVQVNGMDALTDALGKTRFNDLEVDKAYSVSVTHDGFQGTVHNVVIRPEGSADVVLLIPSQSLTGNLTISVQSVEGSVSNAAVQLKDSVGDYLVEQFTDNEGKTTFENLTLDTYSIRVMASGFIVYRSQFTINEGDNYLEIGLETGENAGTVEVEINDYHIQQPYDGATVYLVRDLSGERFDAAQTENPGKYRVTVPFGHYHVFAESNQDFVFLQQDVVVDLPFQSIGFGISLCDPVTSPMPAITSPSNSALTALSEIELDYPGYLPKEVLQPQWFMPGRKIRLRFLGELNPDKGVKTTFLNTQTQQSKIQTVQPNVLTIESHKPFIEKNLLRLVIPSDLTTGTYELAVEQDGKKAVFSLPIQANQAPQLPRAPLTNQPRITPIHENIFSDYVCGTFWEMGMYGQLNNPNNLIIAGPSNNFCRSTDSGLTWTPENISMLASEDFSGYLGDQKIRLDQSGKVFWDALFFQQFPDRTIINGALYRGNINGGSYSGTLLNPVPEPPAETWLVYDYSKIAISENGQYVYTSANAFWRPTTENNGRYFTGIGYSTDYGATFTHQCISGGNTPNSMDRSPNGRVFAPYFTTSMNWNREPEFDVRVMRFESIPDGLKIFSAARSANFHFGIPRVSETSNKGWFGYWGPELIVDKSNGPNRGRIYVIWASAQELVEDPNFEYSQYAKNVDIFVSFSDDDAQTWSSPVKANDDATLGDQFFPSASIDEQGKLHLVFVDRRENPGFALFDIYYTATTNGSAFSPNQRINAEHIPVPSNGGRAIGDYLDMVVAHDEIIQTAYPCQSNLQNDGPDAICFMSFSTANPTESNRVFVSSQTVNGNLGGVLGADQKCQQFATDANLGGNWKAWISDSNQSASDRLFHSTEPYVLSFDQTLIANNWDDLTDGSIQNQFNKTQTGTNLGGKSVWTGTNANGASNANTCQNWTSSNSTVSTGRRGKTDQTTQQWTTENNAGCAAQNHLYCIEQPPA